MKTISVLVPLRGIYYPIQQMGMQFAKVMIVLVPLRGIYYPIPVPPSPYKHWAERVVCGANEKCACVAPKFF